jgi:hypothetical protein
MDVDGNTEDLEEMERVFDVDYEGEACSHHRWELTLP